jgi:acyl carrier protein
MGPGRPRALAGDHRQPGHRLCGLKTEYMSDNAKLITPRSTAVNGHPIERELAGLITRALNLDVSPEDIDPSAPLYHDGLGLDSIDILEIALVVSKQYGVQLKADSEENHRIFRSLRGLAEYIEAQRTR